MLKTLSRYDTKTSAGILARTAMILDDNYNPLFTKTVKNEDIVRKSLLREICDEFPKEADYAKRNDLIIKYIDNELDEVSSIKNDNAIDRLSRTANLPSDLYQIEVIKNIRDFYKNNFKNEFKIITETVKNPESEFHFTNVTSSLNPSGISLFLRKYKDKYPYNNFNLLVVGQRKLKKFYVHQVWRLYDDIMDYNELNSLINLLEIFADNFGVDVRFRDKYSNFFLNEIAKSEKEFKVDVKNSLLSRDKKGNTHLTISHFSNELDDQQKKISMLLAIDLIKYRRYLERHKYLIK